MADLAAWLGQGALLAKVDIESAYRLIPVHLHDRPLLAMQWEGKVYVDPMLPFGLLSAQNIFNAVADALAWHLHRVGIPHIRHYLDDFIIVAPPDLPDCAHLGPRVPGTRRSNSGTQKGLPDHPHHVPGHINRHIHGPFASPRGQILPSARPPTQLGGQTDMHPQGAGVPHWAAEPRVQSGFSGGCWIYCTLSTSSLTRHCRFG